jgi:hypothetical protein
MSLGDRVLGGLKTIILIEERTKALDEVLKSLKTKVETGLTDHEKRLTRIETIIEFARPDGAVLRLTPPSEG